MDASALAELRELRARVYGPDAAVGADATVRARLLELEEQARRHAPIPFGDAPAEAATPPVPAPPVIDAVPATLLARPEKPADLEALLRPAEGTADIDRPGLRDRARLPLLLAWGGSVVAAAVIAAVLTYAFVGMRPALTPDGARQVATIGDEQRGDDDLAKTWFGTTADARTYTFRGLTVLTTDQGWDDQQQACVVVVPTEGVDWRDRTVTGQLYSGCSVGAFPATAEFTVHDLSPSELRSTYPVGTSLQFVLDGDDVVVFADDGRALATVSAG